MKEIREKLKIMINDTDETIYHRRNFIFMRLKYISKEFNIDKLDYKSMRKKYIKSGSDN